MTTKSEPIAVVVRNQTLDHLEISVYFVDLKVKEEEENEEAVENEEEEQAETEEEKEKRIEREEEEENKGVSLNPAIQIYHKFPVEMAVIVLNSTLYMFGTLLTDDGWQPKSYKYRLHPPPHDLANSCQLIGLDNCDSIAAMSSEKYGDNAGLIMTKSGTRICVYSRWLSPAVWNFELYDPDTDTWQHVPQPPLITELPQFKGMSFLYHYVDGSRLYICTSHALYYIDFCDADPHWDKKPGLSMYIIDKHIRPVLKNGSWLIFPSRCFFFADANDYEGTKQEYFFRRRRSVYCSVHDQYVVPLNLQGRKKLMALTAHVTSRKTPRQVACGPYDIDIRTTPNVLELNLLQFDEFQRKPHPILSELFILSGDGSNDLWILGIFQI